jgi:uncharacterized protein YdhG (YjbR/CyaY superfamily)
MGMKARTNVAQATSHEAYIAAVEDGRRTDLQRLHELVLEHAPELEPTMQFGMMGYGPMTYRYASGRSGQWFKIGISNRKQYISLYCCAADARGYVAERFRSRLPKASIGRSCVRFKRLDDLDPDTLVELIKASAATGFGM